MTDPTLTGAGIGGAIVAIFWGMEKVIPAIAKAVRTNNNDKINTRHSNNLKPGTAEKCIAHGEKIVEHDITIKFLAAESVESKKDRKEIKAKLDSGFQHVYDKLDGK